MIWSSVVAMTVIDLLVVGAVAGIFVAVLRMGAFRFRGKAGLAPKLVLAGLACIALFHAADLVVMLLLPAFVEASTASLWMARLHLDARWFFTLVALSLLCTGFLLELVSRKESEEALEASELRFRGFVENTSDWVWEIDRDARHIYCNHQVEDLLGYGPAEIAGSNLEELMHPEDCRKIRSWLPELMSQGLGWKQWLVRFRHRDGSYRYLESTADPVLDADGAVIGYRGIDRDATFRTLMAQISASFVGRSADDLDARIERALGQIGSCYGLDRISFWWLSGKYVRRSHEWARAGMGGSRLTVELKDALPWAGALLQRRQTVRVQSLDDVPDGAADRTFLEAQGVQSTLGIPLFEEEALIGVAAFSMVAKPRNWSEPVESELRLLAEKIAAAHAQAEAVKAGLTRERDLAHSESLAHVGSFAFYPVADSGPFPEGWNVVFSREQCALFEVEPEAASYDSLVSRVHDDDREGLIAVTEELLRDGQEVEHEFRIRVPSGRLIHLANRTQVDRGEDGKILRIVGANRDITEQVLREKSLTKALAEIEELKNRLEAENVELREEIRSAREFEQIIGDSAALKNCLDVVAKVAPTDASILILGETGTGKELIAKAIHELGLRREARLVTVNCSALPADLVESELFGHERGAFTGAHRRREGRFEAANGGTLFLDEIAELPPHLQAKLLRVLQDGHFERVGGTETLHADVRLVAATNRDLNEAVAKGDFRSDLYYRINTVPIRLPPLHERKEDIPQLAQHFVKKHGTRLGKSVEYISTRMLLHLRERD
jgi:PAS domain S-box-containing protein